MASPSPLSQNVFDKVVYFMKANAVVAIVIGGLFVFLSELWWKALKARRSGQ